MFHAKYGNENHLNVYVFSNAFTACTILNMSVYILDLNHSLAYYLTISHPRRGYYKPIYTYSLSRRRSEYGLVIIEHDATNCFSIHFQVFTNNNQHNFIKIQKVP